MYSIYIYIYLSTKLYDMVTRPKNCLASIPVLRLRSCSLKKNLKRSSDKIRRDAIYVQPKFHTVIIVVL